MAEVAGEVDGLNWSAAAVGWLMLRGKPPAKAAVSQLPTAQAYVSWYHAEPHNGTHPTSAPGAWVTPHTSRVFGALSVSVGMGGGAEKLRKQSKAVLLVCAETY